MSKPLAKRRPAHDWPALLAKAEQADRQLSPEELELWQRGVIDGSASGWHVDIVHAAQQALEGREPADLLALLDAGFPLPAWLTPVLADIIRSAHHGSVAGRPSAFTAHQDKMNREMLEHMTHRDMGMSEAQAIKWLASVTGRSVDTIRRSIRRAK